MRAPPLAATDPLGCGTTQVQERATNTGAQRALGLELGHERQRRGAVTTQGEAPDRGLAHQGVLILQREGQRAHAVEGVVGQSRGERPQRQRRALTHDALAVLQAFEQNRASLRIRGRANPKREHLERSLTDRIVFPNPSQQGRVGARAKPLERDLGQRLDPGVRVDQKVDQDGHGAQLEERVGDGYQLDPGAHEQGDAHAAYHAARGERVCDGVRARLESGEGDALVTRVDHGRAFRRLARAFGQEAGDVGRFDLLGEHQTLPAVRAVCCSRKERTVLMTSLPASSSR